VRASKESYLAPAIDALVSPGERADLGRAIDLLERLAAADLTQHSRPGRHSTGRENT
jgi:hypothetical protein